MANNANPALPDGTGKGTIISSLTKEELTTLVTRKTKEMAAVSNKITAPMPTLTETPIELTKGAQTKSVTTTVEKATAISHIKTRAAETATFVAPAASSVTIVSASVPTEVAAPTKLASSAPTTPTISAAQTTVLEVVPSTEALTVTSQTVTAASSPTIAAAPAVTTLLLKSRDETCSRRCSLRCCG
ncbi:uncharacterized protein LOC126188402 [Schistocerca cancellata]|uniref:uncharacterized protein LOC126188402 n=1 Tax=Schistocerca cancellata TaxID=274614 RepID=UPI0021181A2A|nr:uncharacterized protein LOC126188402 [Schistocerca cancellata]